GVWWTWDPRLTTALILWFIYAGCMALRAMPMPEGRRASLCSVVAIAGVLDVPLVFLSARLWRSIHPSVFASKGGGLEPEMAVAVAASVLCFGLVWAALLILRSRQLVLESRLDAMMFDRMMAEDEKKLIPRPKARRLS
ncbi:MAG: cytochrome c biogenesis protein CcsA, partial [Mailhella sp.]|nr:cytochrome c biogenesis protein CcsA [Mailhella sp.]